VKIRGNSWLLVLLAAGGAAAVYGLLIWYRTAADPTVADLLRRLPETNALTLRVDIAALRRAGLAQLLEGSAAVEEPEYRRFVTESGFDWKTDLEALTITRVAKDWYFFARGSFNLDKLRAYATSRGGECRNGICDAAGVTQGRRVSFFPITPRVLAVASANYPRAVANLQRRSKVEWVGGVPDGPVWLSFNGPFLAGDPELPSGGRLFGKVLSETIRTNFSANAGANGMELTMRAFCTDEAAANNVKSQLEGITREFKGYFDKLGQPTSRDDLSGLLTSGQFSVTGSEVTGKWPLHPEFIKKLASGAI